MNKETLRQLWETLPPNNLMRDWQMEIAEITESTITLSMPVTERVTQIDGVLHGGGYTCAGRNSREFRSLFALSRRRRADTRYRTKC